MSRSNNTELLSPCKKYFEWQGSTGKIKYFDKTIGEKGENVILDLPFTFLVLDVLHTIKGFSDSDQSGFWSNEVRNIKNEKFTVRTKKGIVTTDFYSNLAPVLNMGACYCQSVYIAYYEESQLCIGNFQIHGSAIGSWIEFRKRFDVYKNAVSITSATEAKKGATKYFVPVLAQKEIKPETDTAAIELDKQLQEYLTAYFNRDKVEDISTNQQQPKQPEEQPATFIDNTAVVDDLPF